MTDITTRQVYDKPISSKIADANFINLNTDKLEFRNSLVNADPGTVAYDSYGGNMYVHTSGGLMKLVDQDTVINPQEELLMVVEPITVYYPLVGFSVGNVIYNQNIPQVGTLAGGTTPVTTPFDSGRQIVQITGFTNPGATGMNMYLTGDPVDAGFTSMVISVPGVSCTMDREAGAFYIPDSNSGNNYSHSFGWNNYTGGYNINPWDVINNAWQTGNPVTISFI